MAVSVVPMVIAIYGMGAVASSLASYLIAAAKHRDASHWAFLGFVFPPLLLLTFFLRPLPHEQRVQRRLQRGLESYIADRNDD